MAYLLAAAHQRIHNVVHTKLDAYHERNFPPIPPAEAVKVRKTGQLHPEHFIAAGNYLTKWFPMWEWYQLDEVPFEIDGLRPNQRALVSRGLPCRRRLDAFAGDAIAQEETMVRDGEDFGDNTERDDDEKGWLKTGDLAASQEARASDVRTVDERGNMEDKEPDEPDDIPDMESEEEFEEEDPEAKDRTPKDKSSRKYDIYIMYSGAYRTPRVYLQGYDFEGQPLDPELMRQDIMGDYNNTTVTLELFPLLPSSKDTKGSDSKESGSKKSPSELSDSKKDSREAFAIKMASIHPCKHGELMRTLFLRADNALKIRKEKQRMGLAASGAVDVQNLIGDMGQLKLAEGQKNELKGGEEEWEVVDDGNNNTQDEDAISVDQYLVLFLKMLASVTPTIEIDNTMAI